MTMMNSMMASMMGSMSPEEKQDTMLKLMPEMMKRIKGSEVAALIAEFVSGMMFITKKSRYDYLTTVEKLHAAGKAAGWYNPTIIDHYSIEKNFDYEDANDVATVSMCMPRNAHHILKQNPQLAVMMPMQISVAEVNGVCSITWMNIKMMGKLFGKEISAIMDNADAELRETLKDLIINPANTSKEEE